MAQSPRLSAPTAPENPRYSCPSLVSRVSPAGRRVFPDMTVEENLLMGNIAIGTRYQAEDLARMYHLFPRLEERRGQRAMTLSGGE
ncbi:High-affinity branched-chain amino acid transport ATP-binding protein LivF [Sodalis glossinidius str. 'morsitans']|uniref:High-affinity branched-chain amino acid transport ATP-binding protein LivF n=1 Tax=Sodalis glossinidius (strain morsitans) TaxID=343509 RepID=A0A193QFI8_SODGM|nr:High-affinity branched-chain amino acid transport ATP-binding protein LivF [Sodalis glossinidius str. 'morsitans']